MLRQMEVTCILHGVQVSPMSVPISHLYFTDISIIFCRVVEEEARVVADLLDNYASASDQIINKGKKRIADVLGVQVQYSFGKYLGLQVDFGHSKKAIFENIMKNVETIMSRWVK